MRTVKARLVLTFTSGQMANSSIFRRLQAKSKVTKDTAQDFLFADDCALNAANQFDMQRSMDLFATACNNFGLTVSTKKTEVMYQPAPGTPYTDPVITANGQKLASAEKFVYLGSTLSKSALLDEEIALRIARASTAFGRLQDSVWNREGLGSETKLKVYRAVVLPSLLYAAETWTPYSRHAAVLNRSHLRWLRQILHISWQDYIPDTEVLQQAGMETIHAMLMRSQLRWAGHVVRMPDERLPKRLLYGELCAGKRSRGGQKKRFKDTLKVSLKCCSFDHNAWEELASDRPAWRSKVRSGVTEYEKERIQNAMEERRLRKERAHKPPSPGQQLHQCPDCSRLFRAQIGLRSHLRTHHV